MGNKLTTLKGAPFEVGGDFNCSKNQLTTLEGKPEKIGRCFYIENNVLKKLEEKGKNAEIGVNLCGGKER